ncbi:MAG TPA: tetratricopeptide repeat protein, partial [Stenomitos sp.]
LDLSAYPEAPWVMDAVQGLREKSLLRSQPAADLPDEPRFGMYLSIWEYAHQKLAASGMAEAVHARHAAYYLTLSEGLAKGALTNSPTMCRLAVERENFLEIYHRAVAVSPATIESVTRSLQAVLALDPVHSVKGPFGPHLQLLDQALRHSDMPGVPLRLRGWALDARGRCRRLLGQMAECLQDHQAALEIATSTGDKVLEGVSCQMLGLVNQNMGHLDVARQMYARALAAVRSMPHLPYEGRILMALGYLHLEEGKLSEALELLTQAVTLLNAQGEIRFEGIALSHRGYVLLELGQQDEAHRCFDRAIQLSREACDRRTEGLIYGTYGDEAFLEGRLDQALLYYEQTLTLLREVDERRFQDLYMCRKGGVLAAMGQLAQAEEALEQAGANLSGSIDAVFQTVMAIHAAQLQLARARAALASGGGDLTARLGHIRSLIQDCEATGPATEEYPEGLPSKVSQSDEVRLSVRMLKQDLERFVPTR